MLAVISPAKTLDYLTHTACTQFTLPVFLVQSGQLIEYCRKLSISDLEQKMKISPALAQLNKTRFEEWHPEFNLKNARQALFAFKGDVYEGINAYDFTQEDIQFAQNTLFILSGLYGLLRPLDLMQPYRLEMGIALAHSHGKNLYQFWGDSLTQYLSNQLCMQPTPALINLASDEYFKAIHPRNLHCSVIKPIFLDEKNNRYKMISFYAKKARGLMSRFIIKNQLTKPNELKQFTLGGYQFNAAESTDTEWIFKRSESAAQSV